MKRNEKHEVIARMARRSLVLVGLLVGALCFAGPSLAQSSAAPAASPVLKSADAPASQAQAAPAASQSPRSAATPKPAAAEKKSPSQAKGAHEGITVHGHWTIEVKNPDGTVASHHEFENAIDPEQGADLLAGLLSGQYVSGGFYVQLNGVAPGGCQPYIACASNLFDTRNSGECPSGSITCRQLTYTPNPLSAYPVFAGGYTLTGTLGPVGAGAITEVLSGVVRCGNVVGLSASTPFLFLQTTPQACGANTVGVSLGVLTGTSITSPTTGISVVTGQSVVVTVVITFGSS